MGDSLRRVSRTRNERSARSVGAHRREGREALLGAEIRVFLDDDVREAPAGWTRAYTAREAIALLEAGGVVEISLDHDLGDEATCGTGYEVACWIEEAVATRGFVRRRRSASTRRTSLAASGCGARSESIAGPASEARSMTFRPPPLNHRLFVLRAGMGALRYSPFA